jgi:hypothetical protein
VVFPEKEGKSVEKKKILKEKKSA